MPKSSSRAAEAADAAAPRPGPTTPAALDTAPVEHLLGYLLAVAAVPTRQAFRAQIGEPFELRPVEFTLLVLLDANGSASASQAAQALRLPPPHVTTLVARLVGRGLLHRARDPDDARAVRLTLSAEGAALAVKLRKVARHVDDGIESALAPSERATLRRLLLKLASAAGR